MKFHAFHFRWQFAYSGWDKSLLVGIAGGRVVYERKGNWLYSLRLFLLICKIEVLWQTGNVESAKARKP